MKNFNTQAVSVGVAGASFRPDGRRPGGNSLKSYARMDHTRKGLSWGERFLMALVLFGLMLLHPHTGVAQNKMYWTNQNFPPKIQRANLNGAGVEDLVTGLSIPIGIALDVAAGKMYWTDSGPDKIQRANLDGTGVEDLITTGISDAQGIALDLTAGKMYWADAITQKIQRANLDGTGVEDLVTAGLSLPSGIALDIAAGKMYWTDFGTFKIQRANLDGSSVEDLVTGLGIPEGIALDPAAGKMYWADFGTAKIQRANLDGTSVEDLVTTGLSNPSGIALDVAAGKLYWSDRGANKIQRANLNGTSVEDLVIGPNVVLGLALDVSVTLDQVIANVLSDIDALLADPAVPGKAKERLEKAKNELQKAQDRFDNPQTQKEVEKGFKSLQKGLTQLMKAQKDGADVASLIDDLVDAARQFVQDAIDEAKQFAGDDEVDEEIEDAEKDFAKALEDIADGEFDDAMKYFRKAWQDAQDALEEAGQPVLPKGSANDDDLDENDAEITAVPAEYALEQNYPNPFNPSTELSFQLPVASAVKLVIYSLTGQVVRELVNGAMPAGRHTITWNGRNRAGEAVAAGIYLYRLTIERENGEAPVVMVKKMTFVK
jgi:sugar lactone lactonase YvrE